MIQHVTPLIQHMTLLIQHMTQHMTPMTPLIQHMTPMTPLIQRMTPLIQRMTLTLELFCHVVHACRVHAHVTSHHWQWDAECCRTKEPRPHVLVPPAPGTVGKGATRPVLRVGPVLGGPLIRFSRPPREHDGRCSVAPHVHHICRGRGRKREGGGREKGEEERRGRKREGGGREKGEGGGREKEMIVSIYIICTLNPTI